MASSRSPAVSAGRSESTRRMTREKDSLGSLSFPHQELVSIDFDRDRFGSHTQIMHGLCIEVKVRDGNGGERLALSAI
jgi:hypothetical protein